jgi:putative tRNA adenosine deaminase-associated protein
MAVAIARDGELWRASVLDLDDIEDLDALVDAMHDLGEQTVVAFVEEDDEYLAVVRVDPVGDPRVFLSDQRALFSSELADRLFADALPAVTEVDDDDGETVVLRALPVGDLDVLADLGTSPEAMLELIAEEGMLPVDVVAALAERAGCGDVFDEVGG